ncbi:MAG: ABC transporter ATP-binding protein [Gammaproteobacteria bacterium]
MIEVRKIARHFGALRAVDDCSFSIEPGRITGIVGPNGAGKSTVFNIIAGALKPTSGTILLADEDITGRAPHELHAKGLLRTFQIAQEFHRMTVFENLLAAAPNPEGDSLLRAFLDPSAMRHREWTNRKRAEEVMRFLHLDGVAGALAGEISGGQKKLLELGRTLMVDARVVLLDEIAAGVNRVLLGHIEERIRSMNTERGLTFCIIEHDMDFIARLCDHVIVMAEGRVLTQGRMEDVRRDERVIEAYFGGGRFHSAGSPVSGHAG